MSLFFDEAVAIRTGRPGLECINRAGRPALDRFPGDVWGLA